MKKIFPMLMILLLSSCSFNDSKTSVDPRYNTGKKPMMWSESIPGGTHIYLTSEEHYSYVGLKIEFFNGDKELDLKLLNINFKHVIAYQLYEMNFMWDKDMPTFTTYKVILVSWIYPE